MAATVDTENRKRKAPLWWRFVRGTVRGTATMVRIVYIEGRYTYGVTKTRTRARYKAWQAERNFSVDDQPELDEVPSGRRMLLRTKYLCFTCGRKYRSAKGLNTHFLNAHSGPDVRPTGRVRGFHATGKVRVANPGAPIIPVFVPRATRSGNPMNSTIAQRLKAAWAHMAEARRYKLSEIRDDMLGLEQVLGGHAVEAINEYRAHLVRNVGFNPITVQRLVKATEALEEAGKSCSAVIAAIDDYYADDIAAARKRKGGERPSDETLSS